MLENMTGAHSRGSEFQWHINNSKFIHISNLLILKQTSVFLISLFHLWWRSEARFMNTMDFFTRLYCRELSFITLNLLTGGWVLRVLLSLTSRSKIDETLPVCRGAWDYFWHALQTNDIHLGSFMKDSCLKKAKCCTWCIYLENQDTKYTFIKKFETGLWIP